VHGGPGCAIWFVRLFILPHTFIGIFLIGQFLLTVLTAMFGTDIAATVTKAHTSETRKGGTIYYIDYKYAAAGREYTNSESVGAMTFGRVSNPAELEAERPRVRVRHFEFGPLRHHLLIEAHSPWASAGEALVFALFWNGILSVFLTLAWIAPIRRRHLVRNGVATEGTIVSTRTRQGKGISYYAKFRFRNRENGVEIEREMQVQGKADYDAAHPGRAVTVLYWPRNPRRAVVYEFCGYQARIEGMLD